MKNKQLLFKILNKIFNILNFRYFLLAKFLAKYFFFTNYNSKELNNSSTQNEYKNRTIQN